MNEEYGNDGSFGTAMTINPTFPIYNDDGSFYQPTAPTGATNPVEAMLNKTANGQRLYTTGAVSLKANFIKNEVHNLGELHQERSPQPQLHGHLLPGLQRLQVQQLHPHRVPRQVLERL